MMRSFYLFGCCALLGVNMLFGCSRDSAEAIAAKTKVKSNTEKQQQVNAKTKSAKPTPTKAVTPPVEFSGSHILIAYKGAMRAAPTITRSKEEAKKLATDLAKKAQKNPSGFAELAKKNSDCPSKARGGSLGTWRKGRMVPVFDKAVAKLTVGQVSGVVESPFGFHVIKRDALPPMVAGAHILVAYKGAMRARPTITRSKAEAKKLASELAAKVRKDPKSFSELAKKHSDGPSGPRGGSLGTWRKGSMVPAFDETIEKLKIGQVSDPVETPFGFHVIIRKAVSTPAQ